MMSINVRQKRIFFAGVLGIVFLFLVAEVSLRLIGTISFSNQQEKADPEAYRIVFLGNSHTAGLEVPKGKQYSYVVGDFLKSQKPDFKVQTFNEGMPNGNTSVLFEKLDRIFAETNPQLIVLLTGEPNIWNSYGYTNYLQSRNETGLWEKAKSALEEFSLHSRLVRWLYMLPHVPAFQERDSDVVNEREAYYVLAQYERAQLFKNLRQEDAERIGATLEKFLKRHEKDPPVAIRLFLNALAVLKFDRFDKPTEAFAILEKSINTTPEVYDVDTAMNLERLIPFEPQLYEKKKDMLLRISRTLPEGEDLKLTMRCRTSTDCPANPNPEQLARMERIHSRYPWMMALTKKLSSWYDSRGEHLNAIKVIERSAKANPLQDMGFNLPRFISYSQNQEVNSEARLIAQKLKEDFLKQFPAEIRRVTTIDGGQLGPWIAWDIGRIIRKVRSLGATIVVQNYHPVPQAAYLNEYIEKAAKEQNNYFIDTYKVFEREVAAEPNKRSYFSDVHGVNDHHPSERGHRLFARIIYDYLNEEKILPDELRGLDGKKIIKYSAE